MINEQQLLKAIRLNNMSASRLEEGNYQLALDILAEGLHVSKQLLKGFGTATERPTVCSNGVNLDSFMAREGRTRTCLMEEVDDIDCSNHSSGSSSVASIDDCVDDEFFLYSHPIHLPEGPDALACREDTCTAISAALIFNMALANHQLSSIELTTFGGAAAEERLERALRLYELAYNLQERNEVCLSPLFMMAIINNLGLIYQSLDQKDTAGNCFQHLLTTLMFVTDYEYGDGTVALDGFFRNTTHLISQPCPAPAA